VTKFIPTLLLIPVCSLPIGVAYSADAPDGTIRIAAISSTAAAAPPKTPSRAVAADIDSRPSTPGAVVPHVADSLVPVPLREISYRAATAHKAAAPARAALDLRLPDLHSMPWMDSLLATVPAESGEPQPVAVVSTSLLPEDRSGTSLSRAGIGSIFWAARHPRQAWRVLFPMRPGDEFNAYADIGTKCPVFPSAPGGRPACS
jgi:hypothetical protein